MALTAVTVFLSAFLLFLVQPIIAKLILPRFGGSVAVWATCLVFFQAALLLGYAFAHHLVRHDRSRALKYTHVALLLGSLVLLPIVPVTAWPGLDSAGPALQILGLLLLTIGLPFTLLAMTSPLLQAWRAGASSQGNPYRLFAVSNAGLAGRAAGLPVADRALAAHRHAGQGLVGGLCGLCAGAVRHQPAPAQPGGRSGLGRRRAGARLAAHAELVRAGGAGQLCAGGADQPPDAEHPVVPDDVGAAAGDLPAELHAVLRQRPLVPAARLPRWPRCWRWCVMCGVLLKERQLLGIGWHILTFLLGLFIVCMFCHGELARIRPAPSRLTHFYLAVSAGGVVRRRARGAGRAGAAEGLLRGRDRPGAAGRGRAVALVGAGPVVGGAPRPGAAGQPRPR